MPFVGVETDGEVGVAGVWSVLVVVDEEEEEEEEGGPGTEAELSGLELVRGTNETVLVVAGVVAGGTVVVVVGTEDLLGLYL